jgi:hypothetical protein
MKPVLDVMNAPGDWPMHQSRAPSLKALNSDQVRFLALLAKTARLQRDKSLGNVAEHELAEITPARGEHNPIAPLGFAPVHSDGSQVADLRDAVAALSGAGRSELYALMRIGRGELAARQWHRGIRDAALLGDETVTACLIEDPDLHDHLMKGLYEARLAA